MSVYKNYTLFFYAVALRKYLRLFAFVVCCGCCCTFSMVVKIVCFVVDKKIKTKIKMFYTYSFLLFSFLFSFFLHKLTWSIALRCKSCCCFNKLLHFLDSLFVCLLILFSILAWNKYLYIYISVFLFGGFGTTLSFLPFYFIRFVVVVVVVLFL